MAEAFFVGNCFVFVFLADVARIRDLASISSFDSTRRIVSSDTLAVTRVSHCFYSSSSGIHGCGRCRAPTGRAVIIDPRRVIFACRLRRLSSKIRPAQSTSSRPIDGPSNKKLGGKTLPRRQRTDKSNSMMICDGYENESTSPPSTFPTAY
jgi:hypothetical protein